MTQPPPTEAYSLDKILEQVLEKLDRLDTKIDEKFEIAQRESAETKVGLVRLESELKEDVKAVKSELKDQIKALGSKLEIQTKSLEGEVGVLGAEVKGMGKQLDTQDFFSRLAIVSVVLAIAAGVVKLFLSKFTH